MHAYLELLGILNGMSILLSLQYSLLQLCLHDDSQIFYFSCSPDDSADEEEVQSFGYKRFGEYQTLIL